MAKYGVATIFEELDVGYEFSQDNIPLHLTHVDSFQIELGAEELSGLLSASLRKQSQFAITATKDVYYCPDKNILVTEVELSPGLLNLHTIIMKTLTDNKATFKNPHFHNDGYSTHISTYGTRKVNPGDILMIKSLSIASKTSDSDDAMTRILAKLLYK